MQHSWNVDFNIIAMTNDGHCTHPVSKTVIVIHLEINATSVVINDFGNGYLHCCIKKLRAY